VRCGAFARSAASRPVSGVDDGGVAAGEPLIIALHGVRIRRVLLELIREALLPRVLHPQFGDQPGLGLFTRGLRPHVAERIAHARLELWGREVIADDALATHLAALVRREVAWNRRHQARVLITHYALDDREPTLDQILEDAPPARRTFTRAKPDAQVLAVAITAHATDPERRGAAQLAVTPPSGSITALTSNGTHDWHPDLPCGIGSFPRHSGSPLRPIPTSVPPGRPQDGAAGHRTGSGSSPSPSARCGSSM
jgi:hypothetical protein